MATPLLLRALILTLLATLLAGPVGAQTPSAPTPVAAPKPAQPPDPPPEKVNEYVPPKSDNYPPGPDSLPQPDAPKGQSFDFTITDSKIFPNTHRSISVYVPAAYHGDKPACVAVFLDGIGFRASTVFDNLIAKHQMPVTIAIGVSPGTVDPAAPPPAPGTQDPAAPAKPPAADPRFDRSFEFDSMTDRLPRFILEEVLPQVAQHKLKDGTPVLLSENPDDRMVAGGSTGGIGAFNVAWQRPEAFHRVFTSIGTFVGMRGGEDFYVLVRKTEPKPLRVFMEDGVNDQCFGNIGDWWMSNLTMERALAFAGYDVNHVWGAGDHNGAHATQIFPDAMRWLWRDWPQPITASTHLGNDWLTPILQPGQTWQAVSNAAPDGPQLVADPQGNVLFPHAGKTSSIAPDGTVSETGHAGVVTACGPDGKRYGTEVAGLPVRALTVRVNGDCYLTTTANELWRVTPNGDKTKLESDLKLPSGLAFSPDGLWLFVAQNGSRWGMSYRVRADGTLDSREPLYDFWVPDWADTSGAEAVAMDHAGRAYVATLAGIQIFDRNGRVRAILPLPGNAAATGLCFGGKGFDTLYVSAGGTIYRRKLQTIGATPWIEPIHLPSWGAG